jgi:hypothetical protein
MKLIIFILVASLSFDLFSATLSMRRCSLLPISDGVDGAIGVKVFEQVEENLKRSNWCSYISNSGLMSVFYKYRDNLPRHLKSKKVLATLAEKLQTGSLIRVEIVNEIKGAEIKLDIIGDNGEDIYFSERILAQKNDIEAISDIVKNWLEIYSKSIPYDARVNGVLGDQITLDAGKGYPIKVGQKMIIKRVVGKKKHPLLKKIVDWDSEVLAEGAISSISDNQALGVIKIYKKDKKIQTGDWVRLEEEQQTMVAESQSPEEPLKTPGVLGVFSLGLFGSSSSLDTNAPSGSTRMSGRNFGIDTKAEGWITREYFAALEVAKALGSLTKSSGSPDKSKINTNFTAIKVTGGYKYLPIGFFYGPQIDLYGGLANFNYNNDYSENDGFGSHSFSGVLLGTGANIPLNREYRVFAQAEFIPFPSFKDEDSVYGNPKSVTAMELEIGLKYNLNPGLTLDGSIEAVSRKAKFNGAYKEVSYKDSLLKIGASFNF